MPNPSELKILLVEDSPVSQRVVTKQLNKLGCTVDLAANGEEALSLMAQNLYDVVLMDCQMPVLNGYDTTQAIRQLEGQNQQVVVIAMTAGVAAEQERCRAVGMNDYLSKPFSEEELIAKLRQWISTCGEKHEETATTVDSADTTAISRIMTRLQASGEVDLDRLNRFTRGNLNFQLQILQLFVEDTRKNLSTAQAAMNAQDFATVEHKAHQIKGASANVGVGSVHRLAERLEQCVKQKGFEDAAQLLTEIEAALTPLQPLVFMGQKALCEDP